MRLLKFIFCILKMGETAGDMALGQKIYLVGMKDFGSIRSTKIKIEKKGRITWDLDFNNTYWGGENAGN